MARQWRIEYPGALYHVMSRGNGGQAIYRGNTDRNAFIELLGELPDRFDMEIYAYVLMNNHYHLLLKTRKANLSKVMQWFGTSFTRRFNVNNHTGGHLFQGRFKSILVDNDAYLLRLSCYIHRNPLRARIVDRLAEYKWSSYLFYAYKSKPPEWLNTAFILNQLLGKDRNRAYRVKVQNYSDENGSVWEDVKHGLIYGGPEFIEDIKKRFLGTRQEPELPQHNRLLRTFDPGLILKKASEHLGFDLEAAKQARKIGRDAKDNRDLLIYLLWQTGRLSNSAIGDYFGLTYSAVSSRAKIIRDKILTDQDVRCRYKKLKSIIKV